MGRTTWADVPERVRAEVEAVLGGSVVSSTSQPGGWSPGGADRVVTETGARAFVKTLARSRNPEGFEFHEQEARVMSAMPASVQAPALRASVTATEDGDDWIALVLDDVDGRHPGHTLDGSDVTAVLDALHTLPVATDRLAGLPRAASDLAGAFSAWDRMRAAGVPDSVPSDVAASVARLAAVARDGAAAVDGEHLVHLDCRADNLIVDVRGVVWIVDWPWAGIGAHWLDPLTYLLDALVRGEDVDVEHHLASHAVFAGATPESVDAVLAGLAGMFLEKAAQPAPPNMPTLRAFQQTEGLAAARWLLRRWGA